MNLRKNCNLAYLLASRELEFCSSESFNSRGLVVVLGSHRQNDLTNIHTCHSSLGFSKCTTHTCLQSTSGHTWHHLWIFNWILLPVGSSTWQHFVDSQDMERMNSDAHVELILATVFDHVLVCTDTSSFKSFTGQLLILVRHKVNCHGKIVHRNLLGTQVIDSYLGI